MLLSLSLSPQYTHCPLVFINWFQSPLVSPRCCHSRFVTPKSLPLCHTIAFTLLWHPLFFYRTPSLICELPLTLVTLPSFFPVTLYPLLLPLCHPPPPVPTCHSTTRGSPPPPLDSTSLLSPAVSQPSNWCPIHCRSSGSLGLLPSSFYLCEQLLVKHLHIANGNVDIISSSQSMR